MSNRIITNNTNLTDQEYVDFLQRYIIVHSYIYYELNNNIISDREYDTKCKELVCIKESQPELWKSSMYYKQFTDEYNGATGFTLYHDLSEREQMVIKSIAYSIIRRR